MPKSFTNVARFLTSMAEQQPDRCAVRVPKNPKREPGSSLDYESFTFAELERAANATALLLTERGLQQGTRVLLMVKPGLELVLLTFALFKTGAVPIVIDPGMGLKNFLKCVARSRPEALIAIPLAQWLSRIFFRAFRTVRCRVTVRAGQFARSYEPFLGKPFELAHTKPKDLAAILFTSGSTGPPKGVCYEHGMFEAQVALLREQYTIQPGEVDLPMLPIFALFNPAMGMTTVVPEMNPSRPATVAPEKIVQAIQQNKVTNSFGSPVLWTKIGRYCEENQITLPSLKRILIAGAPVSPELIRLFEAIIPNGTIHTPFGATESLPVATISGPEILKETWQETEQGAGTCVGRLFPDMEAKVIAVTDGVIAEMSEAEELPVGERGEIIVRGPVVTRTYDQLSEATATSKITDGESFWHRVGDLGYQDTSGRLWFCGRKAERVETASGLLYTDCCEGIINRHPQVFRSALIGLGEWGKATPAIVIEPEKDQSLSEDALLKSVAEWAAQSPVTAMIEQFFVYENFPVDVRHNAKIHRLTLKKHFEAQLAGK